MYSLPACSKSSLQDTRQGFALLCNEPTLSLLQLHCRCLLLTVLVIFLCHPKSLSFLCDFSYHVCSWLNYLILKHLFSPLFQTHPGFCAEKPAMCSSWPGIRTNGLAPVGRLPGFPFFLLYLITACCSWLLVDGKRCFSTSVSWVDFRFRVMILLPLKGKVTYFIGVKKILRQLLRKTLPDSYDLSKTFPQFF